MRPEGKKVLFFLSLMVFIIATYGFAQAVPEKTQTGAEKTLPAVASTPAVPQIEVQPRPEMAASDGQKITVSKFLITGNTKISTYALSAIVQPYEGKETTLAGLKRVADLITNAYHKKGYFLAQAYIPAQEIKNGIVEIVVLEGRIGKVTVTRKQILHERFSSVAVSACRKRSGHKQKES